ncbi:hypothetical protein C1646_664875 [Rhizophagus diaphanus]|nr:hypothetical protein C1646_664875 [Rhizophagus diaphanus] [Rhizophagus sp. MUCL 43196]
MPYHKPTGSIAGLQQKLHHAAPTKVPKNIRKNERNETLREGRREAENSERTSKTRKKPREEKKRERRKGKKEKSESKGRREMGERKKTGGKSFHTKITSFIYGKPKDANKQCTLPSSYVQKPLVSSYFTPIMSKDVEFSISDQQPNIFLKRIPPLSEFDPEDEQPNKKKIISTDRDSLESHMIECPPLYD